MNRREVAEAVAQARSDAVVVVGAGGNSGYVYEYADAPATLYNMELFYATATALGIALAQPERSVLCVEGEGSFYGASPVLATIRNMSPANLVVLVTDNGVWGTGEGTEHTPTRRGTDLIALAAANGWPAEQTCRLRSDQNLAAELRIRLTGHGPHFVVVDLDTDDSAKSAAGRPRPRRHLLDCASLVRAELANTWEMVP